MSEDKLIWVQYWDMHSGGRQKLDWAKIYIEARTESEANSIFMNIFNRDPDNVTCDCCGEDYSTWAYDSLQRATAHHRGLRCVTNQKKYSGTRIEKYLEPGEEVPEGFFFQHEHESNNRLDVGRTLEQYKADPNVRIVEYDTLLPEEKKMRGRYMEW